MKIYVGDELVFDTEGEIAKLCAVIYDAEDVDEITSQFDEFRQHAHDPDATGALMWIPPDAFPSHVVDQWEAKIADVMD